MKNIKEFISEASRNAKNRDVNTIKKIILNGKSYNNIKSFAIFTAQNPDSQKFSNADNKKLYTDLIAKLKNDHYKWLIAAGKYGNTENSVVVFNISLDKLSEIAGRYEQTSFIYCYPVDEKIQFDYYKKKNPKQKYSSTSNPYVFKKSTNEFEVKTNANSDYTIIGRNFKFSIDDSIFNEVNNELDTGLKKLAGLLNIEFNDDTKNNLLYESINLVGHESSYYRSIINDNI